MDNKAKTVDDRLRRLIEIHQAAADREDLPQWIRDANAARARHIRMSLEQPEEEEE